MRVFLLTLSLVSTTMMFAQSPSATPPRPPSVVASHPEWPKANPDDVGGIENIIRAFYSAISTPAGGKLDQNRLRSLLVTGGRIVVSKPANSSQAADIAFLAPEEYATLSDASTGTEGFFDTNLANQIERFGAMLMCIPRTSLARTWMIRSRWSAASSRSNY